ncbi:MULTISPECIES: sigma-54-dependent transcriptional regulator [Xanthomonas]|uniref:Sigma-54 dependent transcriptional regulator n=1 Tax=Xanthomonas rydalmerensis TaxID=3046274 RepID=A0ABZ0JRB5_9XANT|nr:MULTISPECIES: sigma-54 dependent transcriptional regulator [unclassified Xanthomonas]MBB5875033.1 two-component system response regulator PilR (NtrC family) [Xanthomonas sp. 3498]MBB5942356.1 two-component system response regulator PilR (NtrC family) [Xanthomonas sp. 3307]MXV07507.1 sigma-54-dependent Fis family transcriptional regulator [Xanthomonas sp. LMG 9002]WOS41926.1 sigma-54 dependent transcriptional regulator [Xanthomonas sp. DM-2023]WOS46112.1 sigma-54 dependent transcriptional re
MNETRSALVVDDERDIRELLVLTLGRMGLRISTAANLAEARELLASNPYDLCITDMRLPDGNGIELVSEIAKHYPRTPVAMITAFGSMDLAVEALKAGAFDFVSKPVDIHVLRGLVKHALELNNESRAAPPQPAPEQASRLLGASAAMDALRSTIAKVARNQAPVYILGESGVGKELVARTIHEQGARAAGPFVPVNCGAIPAELMESEFFGHKKGSFTGAHADQAGLFQAAHGGTLFLDEVAELPLPMQVKLLRAIQEKSVRPVGAATEVPVDVRILSATHKDLADLVAEGRFRHDLYYRINVIELRVPPLRERGGDLPQLAAAILARLAKSHGRPTPLLSPSALDALSSYAFPGNVRELENILERALAMAEDDQISAADLRLPQPGNHARSAAEAAPALPRGVVDIDPTSSALPSYIEQLERAAIQKALEENRWNKTRTAAQLGITFRALRYKLKKLGME